MGFSGHSQSTELGVGHEGSPGSGPAQRRWAERASKAGDDHPRTRCGDATVKGEKRKCVRDMILRKAKPSPKNKRRI